MKKLALILFFLFCFNSIEIKAQAYVPLVVDSSVWRTNTQGPTFGFPQGSFITEYYLLGDTIVASLNYKKLYMRVAYWPDVLTSSITLSEPLCGLLREDTINRKVYAILLQNLSGVSCPLNQGFLLYDFNKQVGDSLLYGSSCLIVMNHEVLNITLGNTWLTSNTFNLSGNIEMYEGVGSYFGLIEIMALSVSGGEVNLIYYCRGNQSSCITVGIIQNERRNPKLSIYPNPSHLTINIDFKNPNHFIKSDIQLFDLTGKVIFTQQLNSATTQIDVSGFPKGIYFYQVINDEGQVSGKIIIQ
ncbi:MAG: hypothetical protein COA97_00140 [Flavobacteriales bacterium]|nr:MAG: hypothetical protein COA97_00140 [Flavobacteriales bacterium]